MISRQSAAPNRVGASGRSSHCFRSAGPACRSPMVSSSGEIRTLLRAPSPQMTRPACLSRTTGSRMSESEAVFEMM